MSDACADDAARSLMLELAVEPLRLPATTRRATSAGVTRLQEFDVTRRDREPQGAAAADESGGDRRATDRVFGELMALEALKRQLRTAD